MNREYIFVLFFLALLLRDCIASFCADKNKGICESETGWCYFDIFGGNFQCDGICASVMANSGTDAACMMKSDCCCKTGDMCNYVFMAKYDSEKINNCANSMASGFSTDHYDDCPDRYCYAIQFNFTSHNVLEGKGTALWRGCQSQYMNQLRAWKMQNDRRFRFMNPFFGPKSCKEIMKMSEEERGANATGCIDRVFVAEGKDFFGRLCCCQGEYCNKELFKDVEVSQVAYERPMGEAAGNISSLSIIFVAFLLLAYANST